MWSPLGDDGLSAEDPVVPTTMLFDWYIRAKDGELLTFRVCPRPGSITSAERFMCLLSPCVAAAASYAKWQNCL